MCCTNVHLHIYHNPIYQHFAYFIVDLSKAVPCPICRKKFNDTNKMDDHQRVQHPKCPKCNKRFSRTGTLRCHLENKMCQKPGDFSCPECSNTYTLKYNMVYHLRKKHPEVAPKKKPHRLSEILGKQLHYLF